MNLTQLILIKTNVSLYCSHICSLSRNSKKKYANIRLGRRDGFRGPEEFVNCPVNEAIDLQEYNV